MTLGNISLSTISKPQFLIRISKIKVVYENAKNHTQVVTQVLSNKKMTHHFLRTLKFVKTVKLFEDPLNGNLLGALSVEVILFISSIMQLLLQLNRMYMQQNNLKMIQH